MYTDCLFAGGADFFDRLLPAGGVVVVLAAPDAKATNWFQLCYSLEPRISWAGPFVHDVDEEEVV